MSDDLDRLKSALRAAPPPPDPAAREAAIRLATKNFAARQGTANAARQSLNRPRWAGIADGVRTMFDIMTSRRALTATTSIVALGLCVVLLTPEGMIPQPFEKRETAPTAAPGPDTRPAAEPGIRPAAEPEAGPVEDTAAARADSPAVEPAPQATGRAQPEIAETRAAPPEPAPQAAPPPLPQLAPPTQALTGDALAAESAARSLATRPAPMADMAIPQGAARSRLPESGWAPPAAGPAGDRFAGADPNPLRIVAEEPVSTFSVDVDTASWAYVRSALQHGRMPPREAVRIEEMINYFPYAYPAPDAGEAPFRTHVSVFETPWNAETRLVRIGLQGTLPAIEDRPPLNLVFLVDTSGSMQGPDRIDLLKQSLEMLLAQLRPEDRIAIVTYAGTAGEALEPTPVSDADAIRDAIRGLTAHGATAGGAGLDLAYRVAERMGGAEGAVTRVILATDGDFNVGMDDPEALGRHIAEKRDSGIYLSVLGFGRGNINDRIMQALAQNGNGQAAYIDSASEARKVMSDQLSGALFPIADDVKIQVEWNPATVAEYRLIGYETRLLAREDFHDDTVDAGDIGAGHSVTALYEITPAGSPARRTDPLRYGAAAPAAEGPQDEYGWLSLRYKLPGAEASELIETPVPAAVGAADEDARFAAAVAGFGQLLTGGRYLDGWGWDEAIALAQGARGEDPFGYRAEAVGLMRTAQALDGAR